MNGLQNLDLLTVGIAVAATIVMGFTVYVSNAKSSTNKIFFLFSLVTALWGTVNYFSYTITDPYIALWLFRGVLFFAVLQAFFLYQLFEVFPNDTFTFSKRHTYILMPIVAAAALTTLTPLAFRAIEGGTAPGKVAVLSTGPGMLFFALVAVTLVVGAIYKLTKKLLSSEGRLRAAIFVLLGGVVMMFALIIIFNLVVSVVFTDPEFVPFGALFTFPFIAAATYAILHEHLFNVKVIGTTVLVFLLSVASFAEIIFSDSLPLLLFRAGVFILILVFGVSLIRGVLREVEQREHIEQLAKELERANKQQVALIHFITHQIKGFVTKSRNIFSMLLEGDYGQIPDIMRSVVAQGFESDTQGVTTIQEILNASNVKSGAVTYTMLPFDFGDLLREVVATLKPNADKKGITLTIDEAQGPYGIVGDRLQLENAVKNIVDNAIKYTLQGSVNVTLTKEGNTLRMIEQDTGVGITPEDMQHLFTEGGRGKDSIKVNVDSTGFGLYIVKNIIEAHKGKVWAESEGAGKGSKFIIELPISTS